MTPDLVALETRLLLPLRRAAQDATARLGMVLDPDRETPEVEASGDGATDETAVATSMSDAARPRPPAAAIAAARLVPVATPGGQAVSDGPGSRAGLATDVAPRLSAPGAHRGAVEAPAARAQSDGAEPQLDAASTPPAAHSPGVHLAPAASRAPDTQLARPGAAPVPSATGEPDPRIAAGLPFGPAAAELENGDAAPAASDAVVLRFPTPRDGTASAPGMAGLAQRSIGEAPSSPPSGVPVRTEPGYPASVRALTAATGAAAAGVMNPLSVPPPPPATAGAIPRAADGWIARSATPAASGPASGSGVLPDTVPPEGPLAGLIPIRALADTPGLVPRVAPLPEEPSFPATRSATVAYPALGQVARAMQPVLSRAADLGEAAWDDEAPRTAAPSVSNTFNVTVAMAGSSGPVEREALQDALADLLRDAARRQGLDL